MTLSEDQEVWFWYEDDGIREVWKGVLLKYKPSNKTWVIGSLSWIDLEDEEEGPYIVEYDVPEDQIFETREEAVKAVGDITMAEAQASIDQFEQEQETHRKRWEAKHGDCV